MTKFTAAIFITSFIATLSYAASTPGNSIKVYKWVDANGITHYDQTPPTNTPKEVIKISKSTSSDANTSVAANVTSTSDNKPGAADTTKQTQTAKRKDPENCEIAKKNADVLKGYSRIKVVDEKGEYKYLSEEEKQQKIIEANKMIAENCD